MPEIGFYGGAGTVTGSRHLLMSGPERVLVDCGMYQGLKALRLKNWEPCPFDAESLPFVVLTHTHIDHIGMLPRLVKEGFRGAVICTPATRDLAELLLLDAAHLQEEDADFLNRKGLSKHSPALPLFDADDVQKTLALMTTRPYGQWTDLPDRVSFRFRNAGHLLGSAMVEMRVSENGSSTTILFSGDLGRLGMPLNPDPEPPPEVDFMLLESTYGNRIHCADSLEDQVERVVLATFKRRGILVIPAFAVGRSQQVIYVLNTLMDQGRIPPTPIHLDSPMAVDATEIYRRYPRELEANAELKAKNVILHRSLEESKALNSLKGPALLISSSGMLTGGRILHHLKRLLPDDRNTVVLTGYQAAGTRGRALLEGARHLRIHGSDVPVKAVIEDFCGFSGHADAQETMTWLKGLEKPPRGIFLTHGEPEASAALAKRIEQEKGWHARVPELGDIIKL
ncbi:MAG TPA: MBL fold metallo-hydrolase [Candidatus Polarisedimenticolia bacterium]|nr:MBL fold metallo-hydrolase [Candidatus Polarisedimenticolia bacterium]